MSEPTPGPLKVDGQYVCGPHDVRVAFCSEAAVYGRDGSYSISREEAEANAVLFAASPTMRDALLRIVEETEGVPEQNCEIVHAIAKDALAAAEGSR